ncbi:MAG: aminopeptidase P family protein [Oligoflexia bacterium]|nr:aminopeptidase P family protein [Oligoflexia bacterium]
MSHDTLNPPNLVSFMLTNWKKPAGKLPKKIRNPGNFRRRRETLSGKFPGELLLIPTGHLKVRANDTFYSFRPGTDFFYLTGNLEPDCVLALAPTGGGGHREILFVEPNPGKTDATFFTDRVKGELWEGARLGVPESRAKYGVSDTRPLAELEAFVKAANGRVRVLRGHSRMLESWLASSATEQPRRDEELGTVLSEMRLIKDKEEINELAAVVRATHRGFEDVIRRMKTAKTERELEGVFFTRARMEGNDVGYGSIVASGAHACTLHWKKNDGHLRKGDLLLLDAGIEGNSLYTADITRTLPIGGKFSREQATIYNLVLSAQKAAFKAVKPGNDFMAPNRAAMKVLAEGLEALGILPTSAEEALKDENQFYKRYSLHNVSHMLGLDVHDCAQARAEAYKYGKLEAGMVLTVEPGLYFQADDLTVPARFRGIGVRIEDDVVVTKTGFRNLSAGIPTEIKEIEAWIRSVWKRR